MKKSIAFILVLLMLLSLIACNKDVSDTQNTENDIQEDNNVSSEESSVQVSVKYRNLECSTYIINGTYPIITFSEEYQEKYPEIWKEISDLNEIWCNTVETYLLEFALYKEGFVENKVPRREIIAWFTHFDDAIISLEINDSGEEFRHTIINYDPKSQRKLTLDDVFYDKSALTERFTSAIQNEYPELIGTIEEYNTQNSSEYEDVYEYILKETNYNWDVSSYGLDIEFAAGEIAPQSAGMINVSFGPGLVKEEYRHDGFSNDILATSYECKDEEKQEFAIKELQKLADTVLLSNPSWDYYVADGQHAARNHISLRKISEVWPDENSIDIWANAHGFTIASQQYEDDNYIYYPVKYADNNPYYYYSELRIYSKAEKKIVYAYNLEDLCNGPNLMSGITSDTKQYLKYSKIIDNILYMAICLNGYSAEEPMSNYLVAVDLVTNEILFKTEPLTVNSRNFVIIGDTIICGYGFTDETDWIYLLDRYTGARIDSIPVDSMVEQFGEKDGVLYVISYNMLYEFKIIK